MGNNFIVIIFERVLGDILTPLDANCNSSSSRSWVKFFQLVCKILFELNIVYVCTFICSTIGLYIFVLSVYICYRYFLILFQSTDLIFIFIFRIRCSWYAIVKLCQLRYLTNAFISPFSDKMTNGFLCTSGSLKIKSFSDKSVNSATVAPSSPAQAALIF